MNLIEEAISETSKDHAPWFVIPADQKWFARVAAIQIIIETLEKMNLHYNILHFQKKREQDWMMRKSSWKVNKKPREKR